MDKREILARVDDILLSVKAGRAWNAGEVARELSARLAGDIEAEAQAPPGSAIVPNLVMSEWKPLPESSGQFRDPFPGDFKFVITKHDYDQLRAQRDALVERCAGLELKVKVQEEEIEGLAIRLCRVTVDAPRRDPVPADDLAARLDLLEAQHRAYAEQTDRELERHGAELVQHCDSIGHLLERQNSIEEHQRNQVDRMECCIEQIGGRDGLIATIMRQKGARGRQSPESPGRT